MSKVDSLIVALHSYQYASKDLGRIESEDIDNSVKLGTTMAVALPPRVLVAVLLTVVAPQLGQNEIKLYIAIAALVSIFGLSFQRGPGRYPGHEMPVQIAGRIALDALGFFRFPVFEMLPFLAWTPQMTSGSYRKNAMERWCVSLLSGCGLVARSSSRLAVVT